MFRRLIIAAIAAIGMAGAGAAMAQDSTLSVQYSSPGVNPGGTVDIVFGVFTSETVSNEMTNGAFSYTVPAGLTATSVTGSQFCPATTLHLTGNTLTVSGITQPSSYICSINLAVRADTLGVYPLAPTTLTFFTPQSGSFESTPGTPLTVTYAPVIGALTPNAGVLQGGETVVITGTNFTGATSVTFGGISAGFTVNSDTQITATTPPAAKGARNVVVTALGGVNTATPTSAFYYAEPVPTMSEWALILMGMILAGAAALFIQRGRAVPV